MIISILTVCLNDLENLKLTYNSLLEQSCIEFEWIIKDGGSKDETELFFHSSIQNSKLNAFFFVEKDISLYDAMNQSIKFATGDYFLFLNAGDCLASTDTISNLFNVLEKDKMKYDFIYGDCIDITIDGTEIYKKARQLSYLHHSLPTSHQAIFYNSELFKYFKYPLEYKIAADYAFTAQVFFNGNNSYLKLDFPICKFSLGGISQIGRKKLLKEGFYIHKKIVGDNNIIATYKLIKVYITFAILDNFPNLYLILRKFFDKNRTNYNKK